MVHAPASLGQAWTDAAPLAVGAASDASPPPEYRVIPAAANSQLTPAARSRDAHDRWSRSNADAGNTRYSALTQINRGNVKQLQVAWTYRSGDGAGNVQANPVIVDGVMFAPTAGGNIVAVDARSGAERWRFSPLDASGGSARIGYGPATRGLVYWPGDEQRAPRLFFMFNGYLFALDPASGEPIKRFGAGGRVASSKGAGASRFLGSVAPAIYADIIVAPNQNIVDAYHVVTGERLWHFNTLDYPVADADADNGGNVWGGIAMDSVRGIVYVATGDPHPNFVGIERRGDNRHTNSVLALDVRSGKLLWSFQDIAHNLWDVDIPAAPNLVTVLRQGRLVDAVAQVTKQGNTLLLDRRSGRPLFPFRMRRAPASKLPGESTAPYQPAVELPEPFVRQSFELSEVTRITPAAHATVIAKLKDANFGWFEPFEEGRPTVIFPGTWGGAEWSGAAFDPARRMLYVSANELPTLVTVSRKRSGLSNPPAGPGAAVFQRQCAACHGVRGEGKGHAPGLQGLQGRLTEAAVKGMLEGGKGSMPPIPLGEADLADLLKFLLSPGEAAARGSEAYTFDGFDKLYDDRGYPGVQPPWGTLTAISLDSGRIAWQVPLGEHEELTKQGVAKTGTLNYGGAMVTAGGLIFCAGTLDQRIRAFDAEMGAELWSFELPFGGFAPPATYEVDGRQYVVIAASGGGKLGGPRGDAYVSFALPERAAGPQRDAIRSIVLP